MIKNEWYKFRKLVYNYLHNDDYETVYSRCINYLLIALIIGNVIAVLLESVDSIYARYHVFFKYFEDISIVVFSAVSGALPMKNHNSQRGKPDGSGLPVVRQLLIYWLFYRPISITSYILICASYERSDYCVC